MQVPGSVIAHLVTFVLAAQARGWIGLQGLEPTLREIVASGNGPQARALLHDVIVMLARIEAQSP